MNSKAFNTVLVESPEQIVCKSIMNLFAKSVFSFSLKKGERDAKMHLWSFHCVWLNSSVISEKSKKRNLFFCLVVLTFCSRKREIFTSRFKHVNNKWNWGWCEKLMLTCKTPSAFFEWCCWLNWNNIFGILHWWLRWKSENFDKENWESENFENLRIKTWEMRRKKVYHS